MKVKVNRATFSNFINERMSNNTEGTASYRFMPRFKNVWVRILKAKIKGQELATLMACHDHPREAL